MYLVFFLFYLKFFTLIHVFYSFKAIHMLLCTSKLDFFGLLYQKI